MELLDKQAIKINLKVDVGHKLPYTADELYEAYVNSLIELILHKGKSLKLPFGLGWIITRRKKVIFIKGRLLKNHKIQQWT